MRRFSFSGPSLILSALMIASLMTVLAGAAGRFNDTWSPLSLEVICLAVALQSGFAYRSSRAKHLSLGERIRALAPELLVLAVVMRAAATLSVPGARLSAALQAWLYDPLAALDPLFGLYMGAGVLAGVIANLAARDISALELRASDAVSLQSDGHEGYASFLSGERSGAVRRLASRFATGGAILLMALSLEAVNMREVGGESRPLSAPSVAAALIYLLSGFLLHSRARLALLQSRWQIEGAHVAPTVARRWSAGSLLVIGAVLGLAALLPRAYGRELLETLGALIGMIGYGLAVIGYIISWLFGMLLLLPAWLLSLLAPNGTDTITAPPPVMAPPPPPAETPELGPAVLFWVCVAILIMLALRAVLRRHPRIMRSLRVWLMRSWRQLMMLLTGGARWASIVASAIRDAVAAQPEEAPAAARRPWLERLNPAQRIARYYRTVLDAAAESGHPRRPGQTPREYRQQLGDTLPETAGDFSDLTDAYMRVRYAPHPTSADDARRARGLWQRLRAILRRAARER